MVWSFLLMYSDVNHSARVYVPVHTMRMEEPDHGMTPDVRRDIATSMRDDGLTLSELCRYTERVSPHSGAGRTQEDSVKLFSPLSVPLCVAVDGSFPHSWVWRPLRNLP